MKKFIYIAAFILPIVFSTSLLVVKANSSVQWDKFSNVAVDKEWTITFNREIDKHSVTNNVYILDGTQKVAVTVTIANRNKLIVEPKSDLKNNHAYTLIITDRVTGTNGRSLTQEITIPFSTKAQVAYKTFGSEYDLTWNLASGNYKQFYLTGTKDREAVGGYETRKGQTVFGITVGDKQHTVKAKYGEPLKTIRKGTKNYTQAYADKYGNETSGTYLINKHYVTFFYDAHKNDIVRSITWVDAETENSKPTFFAKPTTELRNSFENLMVELINEARVAEGLNALTYTPEYNSIARKHSTSMAQNNYFSHEDINGLRGGQRMKNGGVSYAWWGENLAYGQYSAIYAHEALMNSLGHRENILRKEFTHIFVGVDFNNSGQPYFTMNFFSK
ncbi:MAG: CAP domain-containing protein [Solibacillus sp.]